MKKGFIALKWFKKPSFLKNLEPYAHEKSLLYLTWMVFAEVVHDSTDRCLFTGSDGRNLFPAYL